MTLTEQAIATIAAGCEGVTEPVAFRTRGMDVLSRWQEWVMVSPERAARWKKDPSFKNGRREVEALCAIDPATVLALCALAQEALQSRREGQQMREALTEAAETWEHLADDLELGDPEDDECHAEELCGEPLCDELGCIIRKRNLARALSHPKPESVKS